MFDLNRRSFLGGMAASPFAAEAAAQQTYAMNARKALEDAIATQSTLGQFAEERMPIIPTLKDNLWKRATERVEYGNGLVCGEGNAYSYGKSLKSCAPWFQQFVDRRRILEKQKAEDREHLMVKYVPGYRQKRIGEEFKRLLDEHLSLGLDENAKDELISAQYEGTE